MQIQQNLTAEATTALQNGKVLGESKYGAPIVMFPTPVALEWIDATSTKGNKYCSADMEYAGKSYMVFGPKGETAITLQGKVGYITLSALKVANDYGAIGDLQPGFKLA